MKEFYLLRHGQTDFNAKKVFAGCGKDLPLNETGAQQAKEVRRIVANLPIKTICHSPMVRVLETMHHATADHACARIKIETLKECSADEWHKIIKLEVHHEPCEIVSPFFEQAKKGLAEALNHPGPSLIVAHGGIHYAFCHHLKITDHPWNIDNCALVHFTQINDLWKAKLI